MIRPTKFTKTGPADRVIIDMDTITASGLEKFIETELQERLLEITNPHHPMKVLFRGLKVINQVPKGEIEMSD